MMDITVENIKCGGCANTISKKLEQVFGDKNIKVDVESGLINIDIDEAKRRELVGVLLGLGYPEVDSVQGFNSVKAKAKSFVSCAVGKIDK